MGTERGTCSPATPHTVRVATVQWAAAGRPCPALATESSGRGSALPHYRHRCPPEGSTPLLLQTKPACDSGDGEQHTSGGVQLNPVSAGPEQRHTRP